MTDVDVRYLDLLKRTLTGAVTEDNDTVLGGVRTQGLPTMRKKVGNAIGVLAGKAGVEIAIKKPYDPQARALGVDLPSRADSMIGLKRMDNLEHCVRAIVADDVPGDLIETGVWRGGACIFMRGALAALGDTTRTVWVADSFQGLPPPDARYAADDGDTLHEITGLAVGVETVKRNFERYGLLDDQVQFLVGWFKDTLPLAPIERLALMRLDGDMYSSTWEAIEVLYPKLSPGGFCIIDDFGSHVSQAQQAVHDYRAKHDIAEPIVDIDGTGAFWRKST